MKIFIFTFIAYKVDQVRPSYDTMLYLAPSEEKAKEIAKTKARELFPVENGYGYCYAMVCEQNLADVREMLNICEPPKEEKAEDVFESFADEDYPEYLM